jgi:diguanylate cyclase (GGDEF)-like protein/PAS domain S-box-containing protein
MPLGLLAMMALLALIASMAFALSRPARKAALARAAEEKRYSILESIPDAIFIVDGEYRFTHVNEQAEGLLHRSAAELIGTRVADVIDPLASELLPELRRVREAGTALDRLQHFQSTNTWIEIRITPARDELLVYLRDISERKRSELASAEHERRLRLLLTQVPAIVWTVDLDMRITSISGGALDDHDISGEQLIGEHYDALAGHHDHKDLYAKAIAGALRGETSRYETRRNDRWLQNDVEPLRDIDGEVIGAVGVMLDVTEVRESAERFAQLARQDVMTALPNRMALEERLPQQLARALDRNESVAVLFIDVDRFKTINDTMGHRTGDQLLKAVALRLRERLDQRATIYRPGGDEFVVVMEGIKHKRTIANIAMQVLGAFGEPFPLDGRELSVTASIGASVFPQNAQTAEELIAFADSAMYRAKESGRNNAKFYDGTMHAHVLQRMGLEQDLRHALARDEMRIVFQPVVDLETRRIVGAESLIRWQHPLLGELGPQAFISIAEESGAIVELSRWVLTESCRRAAEIRRTVAPDFRLSVNLSPRDFYEQDFAATLARVLMETGLDPEALDVEVTENIVLNDLAVETLGKIAQLGVKVSVDDFGIGYSSLSYIKRLPVSAIKIDKAFVKDVTHDPYDQGIVKAIAALGRTLGLRIIAEGIESQAQYEFVRSLSCEHAQGFLFYRPMPWAELLETLGRENPPAEVPAQRDLRVVQLYGTK